MAEVWVPGALGPSRAEPRRGRLRGLLGLAALLLGAACRGAAQTPAPIASQVAQRLTQTALAATQTEASPQPTALRTATPTDTATATPTASASPTVTPSPTASATATEPGTATPTPRPTVALGSLPLPPATFGGEAHFYFGSPLGGGGYIASSYRYGSIGPGGRFAPHHGVDFGAPAGAALVAVAPGTIYFAGDDRERAFGPQTDFYGNLVVLQLAQPWNGHVVYALYGHMDQVQVQTGQAVAAGDPLGTVGATGVALGPHPHLEARLDHPESYWDTRNPELWLEPLPGTGVAAVRVTNAAGFFLPGVRVDFVCADGAARFMDTYWYSGVNPDDAYGENAAMTGLPRGYCRFEADILGQKVVVPDAFINPGQITFVWLRP